MKKRAQRPRKGTKSDPKNGPDLLNQVVKLTGIPSNKIKQELKSILDRKNIDIEHLTLDQLRMVAASYLREIMGNLRQGFSRRHDTPQ